jgi:hypothetical protein
MKEFSCRQAVLALALASSAFAQKHELGLTLGRNLPADRPYAGGALQVEAGTAFQANYAIRLVEGGSASLYFETHFLASPLREVRAAAPGAIRDFASLYVTPGLRVKFAPQSRISPWVAAGGGWALYEHSVLDQSGRPAAAPRRVSHGAFQFGGGVDAPMGKFVSLRAEVRDFYTGSPSYSVSGLTGGQHNATAGGGIVLSFGR